MRNAKLDRLILQLENYVECWKQFNGYLTKARTKSFTPEDETQFLETKSVLVQELELIFAAVEIPSPSKDEVHGLVSSAPSLRFLGEMNEGALRGIENQWHKIFIGFQSILGQLKVQQRETDSKSFFGSFFKKDK